MKDYLESTIKQMAYYKSIGEKAIAQVSDENLFWQYNADSNSIAIIVHHLAGNMLSRWTDFLTTDGEKDFRNREAEFDAVSTTRTELMAYWEKGWSCFLDTLNTLQITDLERIIYIRNQGHSVVEAINRQLAHYPYHIGQIVFIAKMCQNTDWQSLSIPRGQSENFNTEKFAQAKQKVHFTDEFLKK